MNRLFTNVSSQYLLYTTTYVLVECIVHKSVTAWSVLGNHIYYICIDHQTRNQLVHWTRRSHHVRWQLAAIRLARCSRRPPTWLHQSNLEWIYPSFGEWMDRKVAYLLLSWDIVTNSGVCVCLCVCVCEWMDRKAAYVLLSWISWLIPVCVCVCVCVCMDGSQGCICPS